MFYPNNFEQKIGFDKIRQLVAAKCTTQSARDKSVQASFSHDAEQVRRQLLQTTEMKEICVMDNSFPDSGYIDIQHFLPKIRVEGHHLEAVELFDLKRALDTTRQIVNFFNRQEAGRYPSLRAMVHPIRLLPVVGERIDQVVNQHGKIRDNASPTLHDLRRAVQAKQLQVSRRMQSILKAAQSEGIVEEDASIAIRDGHAVIPIQAINKRKIKGFVMGESATGRTVYIEPLEVIELNNEIRELEFAEQREIIKILVEVTAFLLPYHEDLVAAGHLLGEVDYIRAKAYYALDIAGVMPIMSDELQLSLRQAKHPLLLKTLQKEKKEIVPLDIHLDRKQHILLISGPNAGGKSVCLKTVGLLQYMLQCGFLIPVLENSEVGIFHKLFIDIGDEQSIENDLSTYSSHLTNMKFFLRHADERSLILIDEFGTGTEPAAGGAIAEAVLATLLAKQTFGVITTHYTNLKYYASGAQGIINGAMMFDIQHIQPLFKLETGIPGSSFAFEIARKIGLPEAVLKQAEAKMGDKQVGMERSLREIARDKRYWEEKRSHIKQTDRQLDEVTARYEAELAELKEKRKTILGTAREEAKSILDKVNREIESAIRTIRESQADKEKTKLARKQIEALKEQVDDLIASDTDTENIDRKIQQIRERQQRREDNKKKSTDGIAGKPKAQEKEKERKEPIVVGDKVRVQGHSAVGEVQRVSPNNIAVSLGYLIVNVAPERVERVSQQVYHNAMKESRPVAKPNVEINTKRLNFRSEIDLRGCRTTDALEQVTAFIDEAIMLNMNQLRILHGKGNGILKEEIRTYLRSYGKLLTFADERQELGGAGVTVVKFE